MGTNLSNFNEDNITKNLELYSENDLKKETVLFSSEKIEQKREKEIKMAKKNNNNISLLEEINKSTKTNSIIESETIKVKFKFEWKSDKICSKKMEVLLIGSFLKNWSGFVIMEKNELSQIYEYEAYLPRKIHYFKFIVNNKWLCSDFYPTKLDESNNLNNWIDLTNYKEEYETKNIFNDSINIIAKYPEMKILNRKPPRSLYYKKKLSLDNSINKGGNINSSNKKILKLKTENIRHLIPEINDLFSQSSYIRISSTERNKNKLITLIYYKPKCS